MTIVATHDDSTQLLNKVELDNFLSELTQALPGEEVPPSRIRALYPDRKSVRGYSCLTTCCDGKERVLDIIFTTSFPKTLPLVALRDRSLYLSWPHVESDGVLCLPTAGRSYNGTNYVEQTIGIFREAIGLIRDSGNKLWREAEFRSEFVAYWSTKVRDRAPKVRAQLPAYQKSSFLPSIVTRGSAYIADSKPTLRDFSSRFGLESVKDTDFSQTLILVLPEAPTPDTIPKTAKDVYDLVKQNAPDKLDEIADSIVKQGRDFWIVLQVPQPHGHAFGAMFLPNQAPRAAGSRTKSQIPGFRRGQAPAKELLNWYFSPKKQVQHLQVDRFDNSVLRSREIGGSGSVDLQLSTVAIIGCGSVGSSVANTLAQSGVGNLVLVDSELLGPENLSRHTLGARSVGKSKALALSEQLLKDRPQLQSAHAIPGSVTNLNHRQWEYLLSSDLVLFAIGQTGVEIYASELLRKKGFVGIIGHSWLEPFACAGHLFLSPRGGASRSDRTDEFGNPMDPVTLWHGIDVERTGGGCGSSYQPYGASSLAKVSAMVACGVVDALLDPPPTSVQSTISGSTAALKKLGGSWSNKWLSLSLNRPDNCQIDQIHGVPTPAPTEK